MKVFKFGGASIKDANAIRNVATILSKYENDNLIIVVSAIGKTTNLLEKLIDLYWKGNSTEFIYEEFKTFHESIIDDLKLPFSKRINTHFDNLKNILKK